MSVQRSARCLELIDFITQDTLDVIHRSVSKPHTSSHERNQRVALAVQNPELVQPLLAIHNPEPPCDPPHAGHPQHRNRLFSIQYMIRPTLLHRSHQRSSFDRASCITRSERVGM